MAIGEKFFSYRSKPINIWILWIYNTNAFYKKTVGAIFAALITIFLYGGLVYGLIPVDNQISWEGHLFGLIAGILVAYVQFLLYPNFSSIALLDYKNWLTIGFLLGFGALLGDSVKSLLFL